MSQSDTAPAAGQGPIPRRLLVTLAMCGGFAPFAIDTYIAGLPALAEDLGTNASLAQATLTGFMVALGGMQIIIGPLSDQIGRRRLLLVGTVGATLASVLCAVAPSIWVLIVGRVLQGAFGAAGIVLSRAIIADHGRGIGLAHAFALLMSIQTVAPLLAPIIGGVLIGASGWRSVFWFLAIFGVLLSTACFFLVEESLPADRRRTGGVRTAVRDFLSLVKTPSYMSAVTIFVAGFSVMFAYISASSFVLQRIAGFSQAQYSLIFSINSATLLVSTQVSARVLKGRITPFKVVRAAVTGMLVVVAWLAVTVFVLGAPGWALVGGFFVLVSCIGFLLPNISAIAMTDAGDRSGAAAAFLGAGQMVVSAVMAPLTGIGDGRTAVPMVAVMLAGSLWLLIGMAVAHRTHGRAAASG